MIDPEGLEQRAQVRLDRVDGQEHLAGDLAVGRGRGKLSVLVGPYQRDEDLALRRRQLRRGARAARRDRGRARVRRIRDTEGERRLADAQDVAVAQAPARLDALAVDE